MNSRENPQVDPKGKNVETYLQEAERILSMKKRFKENFRNAGIEIKS